MGKPPFYVSANNRRAARKRRRQRWLLKEIRGRSHVMPSTLWVLHCTTNPDEAVTLNTVKRDLRELKDETVRCPWCHQRVELGDLLGEEQE